MNIFERADNAANEGDVELVSDSTNQLRVHRLIVAVEDPNI